MTPQDFVAALANDLGRKSDDKFAEHNQRPSKPARCDWAGASANLNARKILIHVYLNLQQNELSNADATRLRQLALQGVHRYWSRSVSIGGLPFATDVVAVQRESRAVGLDMRLETGTFSRSINASVLGIDGTVVYNQGNYSNQNFADQDFMFTVAHEFGHSVLMRSDGLLTSWGHKGSTHPILQSTHRDTPGYPQTGEIDLMRYYDERKGDTSFARQMSASRASEFDLKRLLWIARIDFY